MSFSIELYSKLREQNFIDVDGVPRSKSEITPELLDVSLIDNLISDDFSISSMRDIPLELLYASVKRVQQTVGRVLQIVEECRKKVRDFWCVWDQQLYDALKRSNNMFGTTASNASIMKVVDNYIFNFMIPFVLPQKLSNMRGKCDEFLIYWRDSFSCRLPSKPFPKPLRQIQHHKSMRRVVRLPGFINNHKISALPDTGAARNMMSASYARKHKIPILQESEYRRSFKLANGKTVRSRGIARITWAFNDRQDKTYDLEFHILADCPCDVLIGAKFLQETETLSVHRHRLKKCKVSTRDIRFVNLCGSPSQLLLGLLNSESISALPDTGSEVNLISEKYARDHELIIDTDDDSRGLLQFADGTTQEALGQVTAQWAFRDDIDNPINVTFEVLAECAYDVILGHEILYRHEAYVKHRTCLVDVEVEAENQGKLRLNLVGWLPRCLHRIKRKQDRGKFLYKHKGFLNPPFLPQL